MGGEVNRTHDATFLNEVANSPSVRSMVSLGTTDELDLTELVADPKNVCLIDEQGGFLFIAAEHQCYDVHTQFLPEGRGKHALEASRAAAWFMFTTTDALAIRTFVPFSNRAARVLTRKVGFIKIQDGELLNCPGEWFLLTLKTWARSLCQSPQQS